MTTTPGVGGNRNALNLPTGGGGERGWSYNACGCLLALPTCVFSWCCPCFSYAKIQSRLGHLNKQGVPHPSGGNCCTCDCCVYTLLMMIGTYQNRYPYSKIRSIPFVLDAGCPCFVSMGGRKSVRDRYNISGGCCSDLYVLLCRALLPTASDIFAAQLLHLLLHSMRTHPGIARSLARGAELKA